MVEISELLAMGDIEHGKKVFKKCSACHMIAAGGKNMIGPNLMERIRKNNCSCRRLQIFKSSSCLW